MGALAAKLAYALLLIGWVGAAAAAEDAAPDQQRLQEALRRSFSGATPEEWKTRLDQDGNQALCSRYRNAPPRDIAAAISGEALASVRYPESGKLLGDWKAGEQLAMFGGGGQVSRINPDPAGPRRGGNCYACHALSPHEVAAGNLGPVLTGFGKVRGTTPEAVRYTYEKIYNAQAYFACSFMPRFGHNRWLTPDQIADLVAFLLDPQSPVNR
jgi:sulfur-oxidizing protein SoxX